MDRIIAKFKKLYTERDRLKQSFLWLLEKARPCTWQLCILFLIKSASSVLSVILTLFNKRLIDNAIQVDGIFDRTSFLLIAVLTLSNIAISTAGGLFTSRITVRFTFDMRAKAYERMMRSKWSFIKKYHSGDIQSRIMGDLQSVSEGILSLVPDSLSLMLRLILAFCVLYRFDHLLALTALLLAPIGILFSTVFAGKMYRYNMLMRENDAQVRSFVQETTENVVVLKTFSMEESLMERYDKIRNDRIDIVWKKDIYSTANRLSMNMVFTLGHLLALGWGIHRVSAGEITYGTMSIFLSLIGQIEGPIISMSNLVSHFISVLSAASRVMELEEMEAEPPRTPIDLPGTVGVALKDVCFFYEDAESGDDSTDSVLEHVSMDIRPGESIALVGTTGSGKTTIARLILSLIEPQSGQVTFYDESGKSFPASPSTRALIAYVPQSNTLSSGTIRENLLSGAKASDNELREALRIAEAGFVWDIGLDATIGERGVGLSEGQAQRIAIARALLRKAPFLILDEASASLDVETEQKIMKNLSRAKIGKTCLVITHRPSLLAICDRCYRVEQGRVEEKINH